jgi:nucleoside 2-deoxyribosyltransferase
MHLLIGEVSVDVTVTPRGQEQKLRLGGIAHAARGFWASGTPFAVAAVLPQYLEEGAREYLAKFGCEEFFVLGYVLGAPNVTLIFDPTEVDNQEYDMLLRDMKTVKLNDKLGTEEFQEFAEVLIFPGTFDIREACKLLSPKATLYLDIAYDIDSVDALRDLKRPIETVLLSTSSKLFLKVGASGMGELSANFACLGLGAIILKENRGGSRVHIYSTNETFDVPAQLAHTVNSVGVGDVFAASYLAHHASGPLEAAWRATYASSAYAQTTDPNVFGSMVKRDARLTLEEMKDLGGTTLPWEERQRFQIYLAAPDFANTDRRAIERAVSSLSYHNFKVRRPVQENGELPAGSDSIALDGVYRKDVELLEQCKLVFAVPTGRDPGTIVEIGLAIAGRIPVVVYDPGKECANTMVIGGSDHYSDDLDSCLNAVFTLLSKVRRADHD